jgi:hypothetical protein
MGPKPVCVLGVTTPTDTFEERTGTRVHWENRLENARAKGNRGEYESTIFSQVFPFLAGSWLRNQ